MTEHEKQYAIKSVIQFVLILIACALSAFVVYVMMLMSVGGLSTL